MTSRRMQAIATRKNILETAMRLTGEKGFENVTIQDICLTAGVSVGAFYHYFSSKEEIILAWYGLSDEYFETSVIPRLRQSKDGILEKAAEFAREHVEFGMRYGVSHIAQLYRAQIAHNSRDFYSPERSMVKGLTSLLEDARLRGELRGDFSAQQTARELLTMTRGVILDWVWGGNDAPQVWAADIVRRYLAVFLADGGAHGSAAAKTASGTP